MCPHRGIRLQHEAALVENMIARTGGRTAQRLARVVAMRAASSAAVSMRTPLASSAARTALPQARPADGARFATGPAASPTKISDELLAKLGKLSTQV